MPEFKINSHLSLSIYIKSISRIKDLLVSSIIDEPVSTNYPNSIQTFFFKMLQNINL